MRRITIVMLWLLAAAAASGQNIADYTFVDSTAAFSTIAATGTRLEALVRDDTSARIDLPFIFRFGNQQYSHLIASTNAQIGLGDSDPTSTGYFTENLTGSDVIVPFGHDLNMDNRTTHGGGNLYYQVIGTSPNRRMIIEYNRVLPYTGYRQNHYTFQVHLHENGDIWFLYDTCITTTRQSDNRCFLRSDADGSALFLGGRWDSIYISPTADTLPLSRNNHPLPGRCLVFHRSPCQPVTQLEATVDGSDIIVSWQPAYNNFSGAIVEYGLHGFTAGSGVSAQLPQGTSTYRLPQLMRGSTYDIYVYPRCGSSWTGSSRMVSATVPCHTLTGLSATASSTTVFLTWDAISGSTYQLEYGLRGFLRGTGTLVGNLTNPGYILNGLAAATVYDIYVEPLCNNTAGNAMMCSISLSPDGSQDPCDTALNFQAYASGRSAILSWTPAPSNTGLWQIEYGPAGFQHGQGTLVRNIAVTTWQIRDISDTIGQYQFYLRAQCGEDLYSDWSKPRLLEYPIIADTTEGIDHFGQNCAGLSLSVSPNPVKAGTPITVAIDQPHTITLLDMAGRTIYKIKGGTKPALLPTDKLHTGAYLLQISTPQATLRRKIIVL